jgi:hypothetical protein
MSRLAGRIRRLERLLGDDNRPRRIIVWHGPHLAESWTTRNRDGSLDFNLKTPDRDADPMRHLTPEMRGMIRDGDKVVTYMLVENRRNAHLQQHLPPWKRRPFRRLADGHFELQDEDGEWRRPDRTDEMLGLVNALEYDAASFARSLRPDEPGAGDLASAVRFLVRNRYTRGGLGRDFAWSDQLRGGRPEGRAVNPPGWPGRRRGRPGAADRGRSTGGDPDVPRPVSARRSHAT